MNFLGVEFSSFNFDDVFRFEPLAGHVYGDGYGSFVAARYCEDFDDVQGVATRDVVNDCAVSDFRNSKLCLAQASFSLWEGLLLEQNKRL